MSNGVQAIRLKLAETIEAAGYEPRSYSGRAMYGERCVGVTLEQGRRESQMIALMAAEVARSACDFAENDDDVTPAVMRALEDFADAMRDTRSDSLGLGTIVYWPGAKWSEQVQSNGEQYLTVEDEE